MIILIQSYNEIKTLKKIIIFLKKKKFNFIVIDDFSNDGTENYLKKFKFNYIRNTKKLGYTGSLIKGFNFLKNKKYRYILTLDADGEHPVKYIKTFLKNITKNNHDLVIGKRLKKNRISETIVGYIFKKLFKISDPLSGFKIYKQKSLNKILNKVENNYFLVDVIPKFKKMKFKISEFPIKTNKIKKRKSKIGNIITSNLKILFTLKGII